MPITPVPRRSSLVPLVVITQLQIGDGSICIVCVCVSACVCLSAISYLRDYSPIFTIFVHVTNGRGSVLLWQRNDTLCISGFMDDVIFAHKLRLLDARRCSEAHTQPRHGA